jgi:hypothetical protein
VDYDKVLEQFGASGVRARNLLAVLAVLLAGIVSMELLAAAMVAVAVAPIAILAWKSRVRGIGAAAAIAVLHPLRWAARAAGSLAFLLRSVRRSLPAPAGANWS